MGSFDCVLYKEEFKVRQTHQTNLVNTSIKKKT